MLRDLFSLFPAYAGVILGQAAAKGQRCAFPRIRGGDPHSFQILQYALNFSPHTRG